MKLKNSNTKTFIYSISITLLVLNEAKFIDSKELFTPHISNIWPVEIISLELNEEKSIVFNEEHPLNI